MLYPFGRAARAAVFLCSFALALPVANSQDESATDAAELGRITVTGSHISRLDIEGPTPVKSYDERLEVSFQLQKVFL